MADAILGTRARFLEFCRYLRSLYPLTTRIAIICDNLSPHLTTRRDGRVGAWATANNAEIIWRNNHAYDERGTHGEAGCG